MYTAQHPFVDYGKDLHLMAGREKGIQMLKFRRGLIDKEPNK